MRCSQFEFRLFACLASKVRSPVCSFSGRPATTNEPRPSPHSWSWGNSNADFCPHQQCDDFPVVHKLPAMDALFAPFGVRIEASNTLIQAAFSAFLLVGIVTFAAPVISTIRVLLSLFVLPGKAVRTPHSRIHAYHRLTLWGSSPNSVLVAHGRSLPVLLMASARSLLCLSRPRATT